MRGDAKICVGAEAVAWAVVAAARAYGDDPEVALTGTGRFDRRSLPAAICGLARASGAQQASLARTVGLTSSALRVAKARKKDAFTPAEAAAYEAALLVLEDEGEDEVSNEAGGAPPEPEPEAAPAVQAAVRTSPSPPPRRPVAFDNPPPAPIEALSARILAALARAPGTSRGLATVLDAKEEPVCRELSVLHHEGRIRPGDMPESGRRDQRWYLVKGDA